MFCRLLATIFTVFLFLSVASYTSLWSSHFPVWQTSHGDLSDIEPEAPGSMLRLLALGDSITYGGHSSTGNGYRGPLFDLLQASSLLDAKKNRKGKREIKGVRYIGSRHSGSMKNNLHEGYPGRTINQIRDFVLDGGMLKKLPDVVLLHVGTNDLVNDPPLDREPHEAAPKRLGALIDDIVAVCPETTILVATIIQSAVPGQRAVTLPRLVAYNDAIPGIVAERREQGFKVATVDMAAIGNMQGLECDLDDGVHPNDGGYELMAELWYEAIEDAVGQGWVDRELWGFGNQRDLGS